MPTVPQFGVAGTLLDVTSAQGTLVVPAAPESSFLIAAVGKRAASNFTFPAGWNKEPETVALSGYCAAIAWKYASATDSGASVVVSTSGVGNLLHGRIQRVDSVFSANSPLYGLITEVTSRNYVRAGSQALIGGTLEVNVVVGFDNRAVNAGGYAAPWTLASSATTATGSDGQMTTFVRSISTTSHGLQLNPNSAAATSHPHVSYTFQLIGGYEIDTPIIEDTLVPFDDVIEQMRVTRLLDDTADIADSGARYALTEMAADDTAELSDDAPLAKIKELLASDALSVTDSGARFMVLRVLASELLTIFDAATGTYVPGGGGGGGNINTLVVDDGVLLTDGAQTVFLLWRVITDAFSTLDDAQWSRLVNALGTDSTVLLDYALSSSLRGVIATDTVTITDEAQRTMLVRVLADEFITIADEGIGSYLPGGGLNVVVATDGIVLSDDTLRVLLQWRVIEDALQVLDAGARYAITDLIRDDPVSLFDEAVWQRIRAVIQVTATDTVEVTDTGERYVEVQVYADELLSVSDGALLQRELVRYLSDTLDPSDAFTKAMLITRALEEVLTVIDAATAATTGIQIRVADDFITISDDAQSVRLSRRLLEDGFDVTDENLRQLMLLRLMLDVLNVTDDAIADTSRTRIVTATGEDVLTITDVSDLFIVKSRDALDLILSLTDAATAVNERNRGADDTLAVTDLAASMLRRVLLAADSFDLSDGVVTLRLYQRALFDLLEIGDNADALYIPDAALKYVIRVRLGAQDIIELGADTVAVIGADTDFIQIGGTQ